MLDANLTVQAKKVLDDLCKANRRTMPTERERQRIRADAKLLWNLASEILRQADE